jgi:hypothetical protein
MQRDTKLEFSLFLIRICVTAFMLVWAVDKIINPAHAQGVFGRFYFLKDVPFEILTGIGIAQIVILLGFLAGVLRFWTYGAVMLMHAGSTLSSYWRLIPPYGPDANLLFWAALPTLAAIIALFLLRDRDRLMTIG